MNHEEVAGKNNKSLPKLEVTDTENMSKGKILWIGGVATSLLLALFIGMLAHSLHHIDEGHVGVYFKYGALQKSLGHPGLNTMTPWVSSVEQITIRPKSEIAYTFTAVTKDAIPITFQNVEVISSVPQENVLWLVKNFGVNFRTILVFDRLREEVKRYAFGHDIDDVYNERFQEMSELVINETTQNIQRLAQGKVEIINLIIPKPEIPHDIAANYQKVKVEWTEKLVAEKEQEKIQVRKETEELKAIADANREKAVKMIDIEKQILQKEAEKNISAIENERYRIEEENRANVLKYKKEKEAEGNKLIFTDEYLKIHMAQVFSNNTKLYFSGDNTPFGAIFNKLIN